jgi:hypothetical protein
MRYAGATDFSENGRQALVWAFQAPISSGKWEMSERDGPSTLADRLPFLRSLSRQVSRVP